MEEVVFFLERMQASVRGVMLTVFTYKELHRGAIKRLLLYRTHVHKRIPQKTASWLCMTLWTCRAFVLDYPIPKVMAKMITQM